MKKIIVFLFLLFMSGTAFGQKGELIRWPLLPDNRLQYFSATIQPSAIETQLEHYLQVELRLKYEIIFNSIQYFYFQQEVNSIPVFGAGVKVACNNKNKIISFSNFTYSVPQFLPDQFSGQNTWLISFSGMVPAKSDTLNTFSESILILRDAETSILYSIPLHTGKRGVPVDSLAALSVFFPDPLTSGNQNYGAPYSDQGNSDVTQLVNEIITVNYPVLFDTDTFRLENNFVRITEHSSPVTIPTYSLTANFQFTRSQTEFEDVNVYYHISVFRDYLATIGFSTVANYQIWADAHALNGADNSNFNPGAVPPRLNFGDGGVDDAEDADVIIHEYTHALSNAASPGTLIGAERYAVEEGNSDYMAASYSYAIDSYNWQNVYSWDGHNEFWAGRVVQTNKMYPTDLTGNYYVDADIWSSTLMQIRNDIGREECDGILLQSLFAYVPNMTMTQAAQFFIQADSILYNGDHYVPICNRFSARGILGTCIIGVEEVSTTSEIVFIQPSGNDAKPGLINNSQSDVTTEFYSIDGKLIATHTYHDRGRIDLNLPDTSNGIYILKVVTGSSAYYFKIQL